MLIRPGIINRIGGTASGGGSGSGSGGGGSVAPTFVAASTAKTGVGSVTVNYPSGLLTQVDDVLILLIETLGSNAAPTAPSGWAEITNSPSVDSTFTRISAFWRRYTSTFDVLEALFGLTLSDAGDHQNVIMLSFRSCFQTGNPWDVTAAGAAGSATTSVSVPTVTTTGVDRLILNVASSAHDATGTAEFSGWTNANLTGITEIVDFTSASGSGGGIGAAYGFKATAGATGATTATSANATRHAYLTIALKGQTG